MKQNYKLKEFSIPSLLLILMIFNFQGTAQIAYQGFGGGVVDNWSYTATPAFYNLGLDYWHITTATDNIAADGTNGNFVGGEDLRNANNPDTGSTQLTFDPIVISGSVTISFRINYIGYDTADFIHFEVAYDNGTDWSSPDYTNEINALGVSGSSGGWVDISHTVPAGNTHVRMRIDILQNGSDEIGLDEFKLESVVLNVDNKLLEDVIDIFPNPATDKLIVKINDAITVNEMGIYTITGSFLKAVQMHSEEINLSSLASGVYFIKIKTNKGVINKRIIKK
jgi:hypothetical protein